MVCLPVVIVVSINGDDENSVVRFGAVPVVASDGAARKLVANVLLHTETFVQTSSCGDLISCQAFVLLNAAQIPEEPDGAVMNELHDANWKQAACVTTVANHT